MTLVVDASAAVKWVVREEGSTQALALLQGTDALIAPELVLVEMSNVLWRLHRQGVVQQAQVDLLLNQGLEAFQEIVPMGGFANRATAIAMALDHPTYDCFYLALAEEREAVMVTADQRLASKVAGTEWSSRVRYLLAV